MATWYVISAEPPSPEQDSMSQHCKRSYDVIVLGLGGVGSAAAFHLAARGQKVLGLDQFRPPHPRGSSHGRTRVIRQAYFEHPSYVPLLRRAYQLWDALDEGDSEKLFHRTGLLEIGPTDGVVIPGVLQSAQQYGLAIQSMTMQDARKEFPGLAGSDAWSVVLEEDAGYLRVESCIRAHLKQAQAAGAQLEYACRVLDWRTDGAGVIVETETGPIHTAKLVITAGPWASRWLSTYGVALRVKRKHVYHYAVSKPSYGQDNGFPCYFFETPDGYFYGTPVQDSLGLKVARHSGGESVESLVGDSHQIDVADQQRCRSFLKHCLPETTDRMTDWLGCYYTVTPDEHFIVDHLPDTPQVTVIAGLSGHGFKFASVLGELAADLANDQVPHNDIGFLSLARFR
ncbi:N-methyl-L-tryptophan oxidase [Roseiconus nitratireducens]|uniref:N-methyl-L-tryptophan oxidase n=1 Tax=Roseiconus nitratireducens TaxID=2605748 RepID=A0A5M6D432_9BACT|nr:N-methyl-L-tryptophan oxidase [Roseiconus nitratireducens]KAA5541350.1 N-methyl-L-tryptophan oxidase [Roseiconus nitratireducens]